MWTWVRDQDPERIGTVMHGWFNQMRADGELITPDEPARSLLARLQTDATGQIWDVSDVLQESSIQARRPRSRRPRSHKRQEPPTGS